MSYILNKMFLNRSVKEKRSFEGKYKDCSFSLLSFHNTILSGIYINCNFKYASFDSCAFKDIVFINCCFISAHFTESVMVNCVFSRCDLSDVLIKKVVGWEKVRLTSSCNTEGISVVDPDKKESTQTQMSYFYESDDEDTDDLYHDNLYYFNNLHKLKESSALLPTSAPIDNKKRAILLSSDAEEYTKCHR